MFRIVGDEGHARARCRVTDLLCVQRLEMKMVGIDGKRTLTDFRGVGGFERFLSSKHFRWCSIA